jgi:hypothetical protein
LDNSERKKVKYEAVLAVRSSKAVGCGICEFIPDEGVDEVRKVDKVVVGLSEIGNFSASSFSEELVNKSANGSRPLDSRDR